MLQELTEAFERNSPVTLGKHFLTMLTLLGFRLLLTNLISELCQYCIKIVIKTVFRAASLLFPNQ